MYDRWNDIRKKFALYQSPYSSPRYLQHIYREILLPYERQRKTLEQPPACSVSSTPSSLLGYTVKLVIHSQGTIGWKWGTLVSYDNEKKLYQVLLDDGRDIFVNLEQVYWQLGAWNPYASIVDQIIRGSSLFDSRRNNSFRLVTPADKEEALRQEGPFISILASGAFASGQKKESHSEIYSDESFGCDWEDIALNKVVYPELDRKSTQLQRKHSCIFVSMSFD